MTDWLHGGTGSNLLIPLIFLLLCCLIVMACGLALRLHGTRRRRRWTGLEAIWTPALMRVLSGEAPPESMHARVLVPNRMRFVGFITQYARRFAGDERAILARIAAPYLGRVAARTRTGTPEQRAFALQTLSVLGLSDYANIVMGALDDPSPLVAFVAMQELARSENPEYAPAIMARLHRFEQWSGRFMASLLAGMGPNAAPALRATLLDMNETPRTRAIAATALHLLKDAGSAGMAAQMATTETDRDLLSALIALIGDYGSNPEQLQVVRQLSRSADFVIRARSVETLGDLGESEDIARLRFALEDENPWVALRAATALRRIGATDVLLSFAESDSPRADVAREVLTQA